MAEELTPTRLCDPDPWSIVSEAREQRGLTVAAWLIAAIALACSWQSWTRGQARPGRTVPS